ncbi:MAG TPA: motility-associated protein, partial [Candidatus Bathyarchaeia archaeon]|nr:motility-associated protein [Candidatus Bathyarchaeia archaeon]
MFVIVGILVVLGAVIGGFMMEHGPLRVLMQPSEGIIIVGAALGTLLIANPLHTLKEIAHGVLQVLKGSKFSKKRYLDSLKMLYEMFNKIRREGPNAVENDIEEPEKSKFFAAFPAAAKDKLALNFVCDTMRMALMGGVEPFDVDQMMEADIQVHEHESEQSVGALGTVADSL